MDGACLCEQSAVALDSRFSSDLPRFTTRQHSSASTSILIAVSERWVRVQRSDSSLGSSANCATRSLEPTAANFGTDVSLPAYERTPRNRPEPDRYHPVQKKEHRWLRWQKPPSCAILSRGPRLSLQRVAPVAPTAQHRGFHQLLRGVFYCPEQLAFLRNSSSSPRVWPRASRGCRQLDHL